MDCGRYDCDCFAFVGFVMERSAPAHYHMIPKKEEGQPRRRAAEYYEFFSSLTSRAERGRLTRDQLVAVATQL